MDTLSAAAAAADSCFISKTTSHGTVLLTVRKHGK